MRIGTAFLPVVALTIVLGAGTAHAQPAPAREVFEKNGLLAMYSVDCTQPISGSNGRIVYRALDASRVQRDTMTSDTDRAFVSIAETATFSGLNEITVSGVSDEGKPLRYVLRVEGERQRVMQWFEDGKQSVIDGVWVEAKYTMPWLTKCG